MPLQEAILEANRVRLRPILMTTVTLVAGMMPLALGTGPGAEERRSIAIIVIGGVDVNLIIAIAIPIIPRVARVVRAAARSRMNVSDSA